MRTIGKTFAGAKAKKAPAKTAAAKDETKAATESTPKTATKQKGAKTAAAKDETKAATESTGNAPDAAAATDATENKAAE